MFVFLNSFILNLNVKKKKNYLVFQAHKNQLVLKTGWCAPLYQIHRAEKNFFFPSGKFQRKEPYIRTHCPAKSRGRLPMGGLPPGRNHHRFLFVTTERGGECAAPQRQVLHSPLERQHQGFQRCSNEVQSMRAIVLHGILLGEEMTKTRWCEHLPLG